MKAPKSINSRNGEKKRMESLRNRPARKDSRVKAVLRIAWVFILLLGLTSVPAQPAAAQPNSAPDRALDVANRIEIDKGVADGAIAWGDYDNDGDLDLLASGANINEGGETILFQNTGGAFQALLAADTGLAQVQFSSVAWGDYDNDGYLDILLTGQLRVEGGVNVIGFAGLYHNIPSGTERTFDLIEFPIAGQAFPNIYRGSGSFADYDLDGRLDILLTGYTDGGATFSKIYRNTGSTSGAPYEDSAIPLTQLGDSAAAWADFNRDGNKDFAISGKTSANVPMTLIYRNNGNNSFTAYSLTGLWGGTLNFFDYDQDGFLDLLVTGNSNSSGYQPTTILYQFYTTAPYFRPITPTGLPGIWNSTVSAGDYDNDGDVDLAAGGMTGELLPNEIFLSNDAHDGTFTDANIGLPDGAGTSMAWGDFNGDLTLDLAISGVRVEVEATGEEYFYTYFYPNIPPAANTAPGAPELVSACWYGTNRLEFSWNAPGDAPAPVNSLTYNIQVGTTPGGQDIVNPAADPASGNRRLQEMGNANTRRAAYLYDLPDGDYYWSVQAVDASYAGGPFDTTPGRVIHLGQEVAVNDGYGVEDSVESTFYVLSNDNAGAGEGDLQVLSFSQPGHGDLVEHPTIPNALVYTPDSPYQGTDSFTYFAIRSGSLYCTRGVVNISVSQHNDPPTDITLSNNLIPNGAPSGAFVGTFSTEDPDAYQTFDYSLAAGGPDNASFHIVDDRLITSVPVDYATKSTYHIRVRSSDGEYFVEEDFTIQVVPNHLPTNINLSQTSVLEHQNIGTRVGYLTTDDPDEGDTTFIYSLVSYQGDNYDNALFDVRNSGNPRLITNAVFDYATRSTYQVRIRSTDLGGLWVEEVMTIEIRPTLPTMSTSAGFPVFMSEDGFDSYGRADPFELSITGQDPGINEQLTWSIAVPANIGTAQASGQTAPGETKAILYTPPPNWNSAGGRGTDSFTVRVTDQDGNYAEMQISVYVSAVNDPPSFNAIGSQQAIRNSGVQTITITGVKPGPEYESGQVVSLTAQCPVTQPCNPGVLSNLQVGPVQTDGTVILTLTIGPNTGTQTIVVVARDNQPLQNTYSQSFTLSVTDGIQLYLPMLFR